MRFVLPDLPAGWPWSLWLFAATLVLFLLQRFPLTGVFLMVLGAALWSIVLVNLSVIGIGFEALTGKVSRLWRAGALLRRLLSGLFPQPGGAPRATLGMADVKRRLGALWHARGAAASERRGHRPSDHVMLYVVLARMGLKQQAGKVEQRYYGPTFAAIWDQVTPDTPAEICADTLNDISNRFRRL